MKIELLHRCGALPEISAEQLLGEYRTAGLAVPGMVERTEGESVYLRLDMDG